MFTTILTAIGVAIVTLLAIALCLFTIYTVFMDGVATAITRSPRRTRS